jgi:hypothetical protein
LAGCEPVLVLPPPKIWVTMVDAGEPELEPPVDVVPPVEVEPAVAGLE